jgi:hypothetical protein
MTIDILNAAAFQGAAGASILANGGGANTTAILTGIAGALGYTGGDVVQFAFPAALGAGVAAQAHAVTPTITVGSITTGNGGKSFGSIQIQNLDLQGTTVWMFGH